MEKRRQEAHELRLAEMQTKGQPQAEARPIPVYQSPPPVQQTVLNIQQTVLNTQQNVAVKKPRNIGCLGSLLVLIVSIICIVVCAGLFSTSRHSSSPSSVNTSVKPTPTPPVARSASEAPPKPTAPTTPTKPKTEFEQVGHYRWDRGDGFTYYVRNPTEAELRAFCDREMKKDPKRHLMISFFDNRSMIPDISKKWYFPESSEPYSVADYFNNPFNGKSELQFIKAIPKE